MRMFAWAMAGVLVLAFTRHGVCQDAPGEAPPATAQLESGHVIWVDKARQRVYAFDGSRLVFEGACSTAAHHKHWAPGDGEYEVPATPVGSFRIFEKTPDHYSKAYLVHMRYALFYDGGRAIHATFPSEYRRLGRPASGGCVRLTRSKAVQLYSWARVGDPVHVVNGLPLQVASLVSAAHPRPVIVLRSRRPPILTALAVTNQFRQMRPASTASMQPSDPETMEPAG